MWLCTLPRKKEVEWRPAAGLASYLLLDLRLI
jgi:hypothetical protein